MTDGKGQTYVSVATIVAHIDEQIARLAAWREDVIAASRTLDQIENADQP